MKERFKGNIKYFLLSFKNGFVKMSIELYFSDYNNLR